MGKAENRVNKYKHSNFQVNPWNDLSISQNTFKNLGKIIESETKLALSLGRRKKK